MKSIKTNIGGKFDGPLSLLGFYIMVILLTGTACLGLLAWLSAFVNIFCF